MAEMLFIKWFLREIKILVILKHVNVLLVFFDTMREPLSLNDFEWEDVLKIIFLAGFLSLISFSKATAQYVCPNEFNPAMARPLFEKSNHGMYISVGSERAFIGAALSKSDSLYVVDIDPQIIQFTQINSALLAASQTKEQYFYLRYDAAANDWTEASKSVPQPYKSILQSIHNWNFWNNATKLNHDCLAFKNTPTGKFYFDQRANYMFHDELFYHLRLLATQKRIYTKLVNLLKTQEVEAFLDEIKKWVTVSGF